MSVSVKFEGQMGNNIFQFVCARLFADKIGLKLVTEYPHNDVVNIVPQTSGRIVDAETRIINDSDFVLDRDWPMGNYRLRGYFQIARWYNSSKREILKFLIPKTITNINTQDIVMHVRLGGYKKLGWVIHPSWYKSILRNETFKKLYIVTSSKSDTYLSHFKEFNPTIISNDRQSDFDFLRSFDRIICSNSTFCWWAAFLSSASRIYTFKKWVKHRSCINASLFDLAGAIIVDGQFR